MSHLEPGQQFGTYTIVRHIAGGGMAQIYLAKSSGFAGFEKALALKVINAEYADEDRFIQMLIDEAKITVGLSHVNIAQVFDLGQVDGVYYIAMEFVNGVDVLELVNGLHAMGEHVPVEAVLLIGRQMCSGLHYAHNKKDPQGNPLNIVHRDISPQNILVSRAAEVKVVDFGIAKAAGVSSKTQAGVIKGKVHYMAPEQAMGKPADPRSDVFSAGIVLWEMLTSQMVYTGDKVRELVDKVRRANIAPPSSVRSEIPPEVDRLVMKALAPRPSDRYASAYQFLAVLTTYLSTTAPEYGTSHLATLIERVYLKKHGETPPLRQPPENSAISVPAERLVDVNSVIAAKPPVQGAARLVIETPQGNSVRELTEELVIGRAGQLPLPDARVSRRHARVFRGDDGSHFLEDLGSANGTFVNNERLKPSVPRKLLPNDELRIGSFKISFLGPNDTDQHESILPPPLAPPTQLIIRCGDRTTEHVVEEELELQFRYQIGPIHLGGSAGKVVCRRGEYWLEPAQGRELVAQGHTPTTEPVLLEPGERFTVGIFELELRDGSTS